MSSLRPLIWCKHKVPFEEMVTRQHFQNGMDHGWSIHNKKCLGAVLLVSSWALYLVNPLRRTFSPSSWRNSSKAGPAVSLLYISSSVLWPALQYITPTFTWKLNWGPRNAQFMQQQDTFYFCVLVKSSDPKNEYFLPLVRPVSSAGLWLWMCWGPAWGRTDPSPGEGTPVPLWQEALVWCRAWRWKALNPPG